MERHRLPIALAIVLLLCPALRAADPAADVMRNTRATDLRIKQVDAWWRQTGRAFRPGEPDKPAVLLFHGLNRDLRCWTAPGEDEGILRYQFREDPNGRTISPKSYPGVGVFKVGLNEELIDVDDKSWFDYLAALGCTVGVFSQGLPTIADAMPTAEEALTRFLAESAKVNPESPPPVALLGHSRGGIIIRLLIKKHPEQMGRVRWVVTLHSPHTGSDVARTPGLVEEEIRRVIEEDLHIPDLPDDVPLGDLRDQLADAAVAAARPLLRMLDDELTPEDRELAPNSKVLLDLAKNEKKLEGAEYYTFGGTDPTYMRIYAWWFTAGSAQPQTSLDYGVYYRWRIEPHEIGLVSPMLDKVRDIAPEIIPGKGDGLVADARAKLPWSRHETTNLNHSEVLWDRGLQRKVGRMLVGDLRLVKADAMLAKMPELAGDDDDDARARQKPKKASRGGLDALPTTNTAEVKAAENDTAMAIRGKPGHEDDDGKGGDADGLRQQNESLQERVRELEGQLASARSGGGASNAGGSTTPPAGGDARGAGAIDRSPGSRTRTGLPLPGAAASGQAQVVPNPQLKGRLGRIVVTFPAGTEEKVKAEVAVYPAGAEKYSKWGKGNFTSEFLPGRYDVTVTNKRVAGLEVRTGHDTRVTVGILRIRAGAETEWSVFEPGATKYLTWGKGDYDVGLPVGPYEVEILSQREKVTVQAGQVSEF